MKTQRKLGWLPDIYSGHDQMFSVPTMEVIPDIVDLRWKGIVPPVRDQGSAGSCTGFGTTAVAWAAMMADKTFNTPAFHPSELFAYYNGRRNKDADTGASIRDVVDATARYGLAPAETWMYDAKKVTIKPPDRAYHQALKFKTIKRARVPQTEEAICSVLASGFPIVFGHLCYTNFFKVGSNGIIPLPSGKIEGGHCEWLLAHDRPKHKYTVQNSWSEKRGDRGYEYFDFDHILDLNTCMDFWVIYEVSI
ncbi:MAG: C1 family peptidase [Bacteroidales bacterium]